MSVGSAARGVVRSVWFAAVAVIQYLLGLMGSVVWVWRRRRSKAGRVVDGSTLIGKARVGLRSPIGGEDRRKEEQSQSQRPGEEARAEEAAARWQAKLAARDDDASGRQAKVA